MKRLLFATVAALAPVAASAQPACGLPGLPKCGAPFVSGLTFMPSQQTFGLYTASPGGSCPVNGSVYGSATALYQCRSGTWTAVGGGGSSSLTIGTTSITGGTSGDVLTNVSGILQQTATETADALTAATTPSGADTVLAHQSGTSTVAMTLSNLASYVVGTISGVVTEIIDGAGNIATGNVTFWGTHKSGSNIISGGLFDISSAPPPLSSFTQLYYSGGTYTFNQSAGGAITISALDTDGAGVGGIYIAAPTPPYRVAILLEPNALIGNYIGFGAGWTDGTKIQDYMQYWNNGLNAAIDNRNSVGSRSSFTGANAISYITQPFWIGLHDDGTNVIFEGSTDGVYFTALYPPITKSSGFLSGAYNYIYIVSNSNSVAWNSYVTVRAYNPNALTASFP